MKDEFSFSAGYTSAVDVFHTLKSQEHISGLLTSLINALFKVVTPRIQL